LALFNMAGGLIQDLLPKMNNMDGGIISQEYF